MNMEKELKLYGLEEVGEILGVSVRTLYRYIKSGELKAKKIGNKWLVSHEDLKAYIDSK